MKNIFKHFQNIVVLILVGGLIISCGINQSSNKDSDSETLRAREEQKSMYNKVVGEYSLAIPNQQDNQISCAFLKLYTVDVITGYDSHGAIIETRLRGSLTDTNTFIYNMTLEAKFVESTRRVILTPANNSNKDENNLNYLVNIDGEVIGSSIQGMYKISDSTSPNGSGVTYYSNSSFSSNCQDKDASNQRSQARINSIFGGDWEGSIIPMGSPDTQDNPDRKKLILSVQIQNTEWGLTALAYAIDPFLPEKAYLTSKFKILENPFSVIFENNNVQKRTFILSKTNSNTLTGTLTHPRGQFSVKLVRKN